MLVKRVTMCCFLCVHLLAVQENLEPLINFALSLKSLAEEDLFWFDQEVMEKFNPNAQVPRSEMLDPEELKKFDPARMSEALSEKYQIFPWDEDSKKSVCVPETAQAFENLKTKYKPILPEKELKFLGGCFDECDCPIFGRISKFISVRDLAEKMISDSIVNELKKTKTVHYLAFAPGGCYFDYRVLERVCLKWKEIKGGAAELQVYFVDPECPLINIDDMLKDLQCGGAKIELEVFRIKIEDFPRDQCPTIIGGIDFGLDNISEVIVSVCKDCAKKLIRGVFFLDNSIAKNGKWTFAIRILQIIRSEEKVLIEQLKKRGYKQLYEDLINKDELVALGKDIPFSDEGVGKFKDELQRVGLIK